jgi:predicted RecB family nuclease
VTILLGAYAARSCPVKTQNAFDPTVEKRAWEPDDSLAELFDGGAAYEAQVLDRLVSTFRGRLVDLRDPADASAGARTRACRDAMCSGAEVIVAGWLPDDLAGHRVGQPELLVRGADQPDGTPRYHPVEVKWHKIIERHSAWRGRPGSQPAERPPLRYTTLPDPRPLPAQELAGHGLRFHTREADLLQLAHYHRMLQAVGFATDDDARGAVIGTDDVLGMTLLAWVDLAEPLVRTFSRSDPEGWRLRSVLERYDHEYAFRLDVATVATQQSGHPESDPALLVRPIVTTECGRCPWWEHCLPQLDPDDVSLRIDKGPLDVREIAALRHHGIQTITDLANADPDELSSRYLPEVTHRSGAESRLRVATRRARMLLSGEPLERESTGPIDVPAAEVEVDFDIETASDGRIYLWGFLVTDARSGSESSYVAFSRFTDLDAGGEAELAREALTWLHDLVGGDRSVRVYHYSGYEVAAIKTLAERLDDPLFQWAVGYAQERFVDLLELVKEHYFGVSGLGLKMVASQGAGFRWRDDDPGGLNSQRWFADAVHEESQPVRSAARQRVLDYNEDDVIATARVRAWLRAS